MTNDNGTSLQIFTLVFQVVMLLVILFGAGRFIGQTTQILKQLQNSHDEFKDKLEEHATKINSLEVAIANIRGITSHGKQ